MKKDLNSNDKPVVRKARKGSPFDFLHTKIDSKEIVLISTIDELIECSIVSFDAYNIVVLDTTTKKKRLLFKQK
jgi:small nuclear ribonucleoprotein (snRNP)-like protein